VSDHEDVDSTRFFHRRAVPAENLVGEINEGWRVATVRVATKSMLWMDYCRHVARVVRGDRPSVRCSEIIRDPVWIAYAMAADGLGLAG